VRLAATRADDGDIAALSGLVRRQAEVSEFGDHEHFAVLDDDFHAAICELAGRPVAWEVAQRVKGHLNRVAASAAAAALPRRDGGRASPSCSRRLDQRDPDAAEATLRHHLRMVLSALPAIRAQHPDYLKRSAPDGDRDRDIARALRADAC